MPCPSKTLSLLLLLPFLASCATPEADIATLQETDPGLPAEIPAEEEITTNPPPEPAPPPGDTLKPADLIGLEPGELQNLLGKVSLKRWEGEVQVMQFAGGDCVLDVYLFETAPGEAYEVTYLTARNSTGIDISSEQCLALLSPKTE